MDNLNCEIRVRGEWIRISIDDALRLDASELKRCPACHGRVRAHKKGTTEQRAHFEHLTAHPGCQRRGKYFSGHASLHPEALD